MNIPNPLNVKVIGERAPGDARPSRSASCGHCGRGLAWNPDGNGLWADHSTNWECPSRPGPDGFGPHQPASPILHPPAP